MSTQCLYCQKQLRSSDIRFCPYCGQPQIVVPPSPEMGNKKDATSSTPHLVIELTGHTPRIEKIEKFPIVIGRDSACDIVLDQHFVSRRHAQIEQRGDSYWVIDLNSTNGINLNRQQIGKGGQAPLEHGSIIRIGDALGNSVKVTFELRTVLPQQHHYTKKIGQYTFDSQVNVEIIGRDPTCQIVLDHPSVSRRHAELRLTTQGHRLRDLGSANGISVNGQPIRQEVILKTGDRVQIGQFLLVYDGKALNQYSADGNYRIDVKQISKIVTGRNGKPKKILNDINLSIQPRQFVALVGGSGAGKSTLLKALSGMDRVQAGEIYVNGNDLYDNFSVYRSTIGYVPQDDIIHLNLTVRKALQYAAQLRLPDATSAEIEKRIEKVVDDVELTAHLDTVIKDLSGGQRKRVSIAVELLADPGIFFLDEPTSGLDPGLEKKFMRMMHNLADEGRTIILVTHATANIDQCSQVAFLGPGGYLTYFGPPHEATNHFEAADFADIYSKLSAETINTTQLPAGCKVEYQQLQQTASPNEPPKTSAVWANYFKKTSLYKNYVIDRLAQLPPPSSQSTLLKLATAPSRQRGYAMSQFKVLSRRYFDLILRDRISTLILLGVMPVIALLLMFVTNCNDLIGLGVRDQCLLTNLSYDGSPRKFIQENMTGKLQEVYQPSGDAQKALFIIALAPALLGLFAACNEIIKESAIYRRERLVNLRIWPYLLSKTVVLSAFGFLQSFLFLWIVSLSLSLPTKGILFDARVEFFITIFLATVTSISLGLLVSSIVNNATLVPYIVLVLLFLQILFGGLIFSPPAPISWLTTTRGTLEALGAITNLDELKKEGGVCIMGKLDIPALQGNEKPAHEYCKDGQTALPAEYTFFVNYSTGHQHLMGIWLWELFLAVSFHCLAYLMLKRKDVSS